MLPGVRARLVIDHDTIPSAGSEEERERVRERIESQAYERILDRVQTMEALQEQADRIEERLEENEGSVMESFYQMMEERSR